MPILSSISFLDLPFPWDRLTLLFVCVLTLYLTNKGTKKGYIDLVFRIGDAGTGIPVGEKKIEREKSPIAYWLIQILLIFSFASCLSLALFRHQSYWITLPFGLIVGVALLFNQLRLLKIQNKTRDQIAGTGGATD